MRFRFFVVFLSSSSFVIHSLGFATDVTFVSVSRLTGRVEVEEVVAAVRANTCLVSIMLANNETGVIMVSDWKNL